VKPSKKMRDEANSTEEAVVPGDCIPKRYGNEDEVPKY